MSEAEQNETPQRTEDEWVELESELAEVRKKRDQLDAQNLRVTDNLRRTIDERDKAVEVIAALREQLVEMTAERDAVKKVSGSANRMIEALQCDVRQLQAERDAARKFADDTQVELSQWQVGHDAIKEQLAQAKEAADMFEAKNIALRDTVRQLQAKQVHGDLPGLLMSIQLAAEQARLSI